MDSQYKLLSELLSDQAAFITSPKTSLANYWGGIAPLPPPSVYGPVYSTTLVDKVALQIRAEFGEDRIRFCKIWTSIVSKKRTRHLQTC